MNVPDGWAVHSCVCGATEIIAGPGVTVEMRCPTCPPDVEVVDLGGILDAVPVEEHRDEDTR